MSRDLLERVDRRCLAPYIKKVDNLDRTNTTSRRYRFPLTIDPGSG